MDYLYILDKNFDRIEVLDNYTSLIWTERYSDVGDFELTLPFYIQYLPSLIPDNYICMDESDVVMVIEDVNLSSDSKEGYSMTITGRSLESVLDRRIVWNKTIINPNDNDTEKFQTSLKKILDSNIIKPSDSARKIPNFNFIVNDDPRFNSKDAIFNGYFYGETLLEVVNSVCSTFDCGYSLRLNKSTKQLNFKLYYGVDRSFDQDKVPRIIFSPDYDNLSSSNVYNSIYNYKNTALVYGEKEVDKPKTLTITDSKFKGYNRRETFVDASGINPYDDNQQLISDSLYMKLMKQKGYEELLESSYEDAFDGTSEDSLSFKYGKDYFIGDIVQTANEFGYKSRSRITEFIRSKNVNKSEQYPTFTSI